MISLWFSPIIFQRVAPPPPPSNTAPSRPPPATPRSLSQGKTLNYLHFKFYSGWRISREERGCNRLFDLLYSLLASSETELHVLHDEKPPSPSCESLETQTSENEFIVTEEEEVQSSLELESQGGGKNRLALGGVLCVESKIMVE